MSDGAYKQDVLCSVAVSALFVLIKEVNRNSSCGSGATCDAMPHAREDGNSHSLRQRPELDGRFLRLVNRVSGCGEERPFVVVEGQDYGDGTSRCIGIYEFCQPRQDTSPVNSGERTMWLQQRKWCPLAWSLAIMAGGVSGSCGPVLSERQKRVYVCLDKGF